MDRCNESNIEYTDDGMAIVNDLTEEQALLLRRLADREVRIVTVPATQLRIPLAV